MAWIKQARNEETETVRQHCIDDQHLRDMVLDVMRDAGTKAKAAEALKNFFDQYIHEQQNIPTEGVVGSLMADVLRKVEWVQLVEALWPEDEPEMEEDVPVMPKPKTGPKERRKFRKEM